MTPEEAILSALKYEKVVRDYYAKVGQEIEHPKGREVFKALADEEQYHVDYLEKRLKFWRQNGRLDKEAIKTTLPSKDWIEKGQKAMKGTPIGQDLSTEIAHLRKALKMEQDVSDHYKALIAELTDDAQEMFKRFLEIEDGHTAIVRAEIDALQGNGFWFDFAEFNLEAG